MKKKLWFWLCLIEAAVILVGGCAVLFSTPSVFYEGEMDIRSYVDDLAEDNNYAPEVGYIPDYETAGEIGGAIIDELTGEKGIGAVTVCYDADNRLWLVTKNYFPHDGGFVVIEQDSGKVIKALLNK